MCKYLRKYKSWGLIYQRPKPLEGLPDVPFDFATEDPTLPIFPVLDPTKLTGLVDAAHATDLKTRRSVTGLSVMFGGAAIAWKSRLMAVVATSSTEAEFLSAVTCAKIVKYLRYVLKELDLLQKDPTTIYIDNEAALNMINERRPTPRARHVDIQHFAIQEWREAGDIVMNHIPGTINPSDDLTKALSWILHARHARRNMGHYMPLRLKEEASHIPHHSHSRGGQHEAGEGVRANSGLVPYMGETSKNGVSSSVSSTDRVQTVIENGA